MNSKTVFLLISLLTSRVVVLAQTQIQYSGKASYDCVFVEANPPSWKANLYYNNTKDKFYQQLSDDKKQDIVLNKDGEMIIAIKPISDSINRYVWAKASIQKLYTRTIVSNKKWVIVEENLPACSWAIVPDSSKIIGSMRCQKATTSFRGRNYELWFCPQIPVSVGPWKFNNLPGLAVSIKSTDNEVAFLLKENKIFNGQKPVKSIYFKDQIVSVGQLKQLQNAERERMIKVIASFSDKNGSSSGTVSEVPDIEKK